MFHLKNEKTVNCYASVLGSEYKMLPQVSLQYEVQLMEEKCGKVDFYIKLSKEHETSI